MTKALALLIFTVFSMHAADLTWMRRAAQVGACVSGTLEVASQRQAVAAGVQFQSQPNFVRTSIINSAICGGQIYLAEYLHRKYGVRPSTDYGMIGSAALQMGMHMRNSRNNWDLRDSMTRARQSGLTQ